MYVIDRSDVCPDGCATYNRVFPSEPDVSIKWTGCWDVIFILYIKPDYLYHYTTSEFPGTDYFLTLKYPLDDVALRLGTDGQGASSNM